MFLQAAFVFVVALALLVCLGRGFGPYWDSWNFFFPTEKFSLWISSWWDGNPAPPITEWRHYFPEEPRHPPLMEWGAALCHALFKRELGDLGSCRLFISIFAALWCAAMYLFTAPRVGKGAALLGLALLAGSPRFWVDAVILNIDGLMAATYGLALLAFLKWDKGARGKLLVFGALVLALLTKLQGLFLIPILFAWAASRGVGAGPRIRQAGMACSVAIAALAGVFLIWPAMWIDFPSDLLRYLRFITRHSNVPVLYFGTLYKGDSVPPWHYPWVFTAIALPLAFWVPSLVRGIRILVGRGFRPGNFQGADEALLWVGMLFPLLVSSMPQAPKYDGVRLLLPAYAPMAILSTLEVAAWWKAIEARGLQRISSGLRKALPATVGLLLALPTVRIYPYNLVYYSPLVGGVTGARKLGFELDFLGVSMHQLNPKLQEVARAGDILLLAGCNALVAESGPEGWPAVPRGIRSIDFKLVREVPYKGRSVFAILSSRYGDLTPEAWLVLEKVPPLATVTYRGERLFSLHRITEEFVRSLPPPSDPFPVGGPSAPPSKDTAGSPPAP
ncbi:MAG: hypothetical protein GHCLOJNM_03757 [bacterium]|nr:hypothetical protein [bacterium]